MKITRIELKDFHQFKDLTIDLTYPEGKERHVDGYTIIPSYLTYDLMLSKVFK